MKKLQSLRVGAILAVAVLASAAGASEFYGMKQNGTIVRYDMTAQTVSVVSSVHVGPTSVSDFEDLEFDGSGNLYALRSYFDFNTFSSFNELYRITNPSNGSALLSGSVGGGANPFSGFMYSSAGSSFYSIHGGNGYLCTLATNGAFNPVSGVANNNQRFLSPAMAVNPVNGQAYSLIDMGIAIAGTTDYTLVSLNLATGVGTLVGSLNLPQQNFQSLRFDESGNLYTVDTFGGGVYSVNTGTGAASFLFNGGSNAVGTRGLALISVPAPAGAGILVLGGLMAARRRR